MSGDAFGKQAIESGGIEVVEQAMVAVGEIADRAVVEHFGLGIVHVMHRNRSMRFVIECAFASKCEMIDLIHESIIS